MGWEKLADRPIDSARAMGERLRENRCISNSACSWNSAKWWVSTHLTGLATTFTLLGCPWPWMLFQKKEKKTVSAPESIVGAQLRSQSAFVQCREHVPKQAEDRIIWSWRVGKTSSKCGRLIIISVSFQIIWKPFELLFWGVGNHFN